MKLDKFKKLLEIYGSDIKNWPEEMHRDVYSSIEKNPDFRDLLRNQQAFENFLNLREINEHSPDFQNRIIKAAKIATNGNTNNNRSLSKYLNEIFITFHMPRPAISLGLVLFMGITLGYLLNFQNNQNFQDESNIEEIAFYEGDLYEF